MAAITSALFREAPEEPEVAESGRRRRSPYYLLLPGLGWLVLFFIVPLISVFLTSLQKPLGATPASGYTAGFRLSNYTDALSNYGTEFIRSFVYSGIATVLALLIAFPLAYFIAFRAGRWRDIWSS